MMRVAYTVTIEVAPAVEAEWDRWHSEVHIPEILAQPGFLGATKYRDESPCFDDWVRYVCRYDVESGEALAAYLRGSESARIRADHDTRWRTTTRVSRQTLVETA